MQRTAEKFAALVTKLHPGFPAAHTEPLVCTTYTNWRDAYLALNVLNGIVEPFEKHILATKSKCLGCERQGNYLQIGECGHHPASSHIAMVVYTIPCKLFADVKNFTEFYDKVVHTMIRN